MARAARPRSGQERGTQRVPAGGGRRRPTPEADKGRDLSALPAKAAFAEDGYVRLPGVLSEDEVAALEAVYDRFLRQEIGGRRQGLLRHGRRLRPGGR